MMKKNLRVFTAAAAVSVAAVFTACNGGDDWMDAMPDPYSDTRATLNPDGTLTITFDDFDAAMMAGPTSRAENYYTYYGFDKSQQIREIADPDACFVSDMNTVNSPWTGPTTEFSSGAIALSKWNYRSNPGTYPQDPAKPIPTDWWYSWENQCSVYNTTSVDGTNVAAGHSGSNFGVVYGYSDSYNQDWMAKPEFYFDQPRKFIGLWYCNSSYTYGVIKYGNQFGGAGSGKPLETIHGYFKVLLECYDVSGNLIATKEMMLADYRNAGQKIEPVTTWTYWEINVEQVQSVKFNFEGSDTSAYGLNTPTYLCIDDLRIQ